MKKETQKTLKIFVPLLAFSALLEGARWCSSPYWEGVLHGLCIGLLLMAGLRIAAFLYAAFKAHPTYSQRKQQHNGNNQTL